MQFSWVRSIRVLVRPGRFPSTGFWAGCLVAGCLAPVCTSADTAPRDAPRSAAATRAAAVQVPPPEKEAEDVRPDEEYFTPILADIARALAGVADVASMNRHILEGGSPHLVLFLEGKAGFSPPDHPALQTLRAVAGNYQLGLEHQAVLLKDGAVLLGFILYKPFPTLELAWELNPFESVAAESGAWRRPFADLADMESVQIADDRATLTLTGAAARRIDALSTAHGHRTYRVRGVEIAEAANLGTYTWVPGLRSVPGVPASFTCRLPRRGDQWKEGISLEYLHQRFAVHAAAREQVRTELGLPDDINWTAGASAPSYREPFYGCIVGAAGAAGTTLLPRLEPGGDPSPRWLPVLSDPSPASNAAIPRHWQFARTDGGSGFVPRRGDGAAALAQDEALESFLRQNLGREMALVMQGRIVAVLPIGATRPEALPIVGLSRNTADRIAALWRAANPGAPGEPGALEATAAAETAALAPDSFQVRLMAEPQDRELVPVTHFPAPGAARGVLVAVQDGVILDSHVVKGARLENRADKLYLRLSLTPEGQEALDGACFTNMGKQLAIVYDGKLLCAPTIDEWDQVELAFKGLNDDWPDVARKLAAYLGDQGAGGEI